MAKLTDPEIIQALEQGKRIKRIDDDFETGFDEIHQVWYQKHNSSRFHHNLDLDELKATDWIVVEEEWQS